MFRTNRLAANAAGTEVRVYDAEPLPVTLAPKRRRKPPPEPPAPETERCCRKCQETKGLEEFARSRQSRDGRTSMCKSCDAQRSRERYRANFEKECARAGAYGRSERGRARRQERYAANSTPLPVRAIRVALATGPRKVFVL